jgi:hypothetical protein
MINIVTTAAAEYAARELHRFLNLALTETVTLAAETPADRTCTLAIDPHQKDEIAIDHTAAATTVSGRTAAAVLHGVYCFLEKLGYVFTACGPVAPASPAAWPKPFRLRHTPLLAQRGIRQHINFPMDISCLPLEAAREYVRNLARLKLNFMAFHLYYDQGWLQFDYRGYKVGHDSKTTLYYSEYHPVARDPVVRAQSASRATWFIPEFETHYRGAQQPALLRGWLRAVMQCAKECGMTVTASVEVLSPAADKELAVTGEAPGPELYARVTAAAALAALEQYPEIDQIELISREGESSWPSPPTLAEAVAAMKAEFGIPDAEWRPPVTDMPGEPQVWSSWTIVSGVRALQVAVRAMALMRQDPRAERVLGARPIVCGLYTTLYQSWNYLGPLVRRLVPPDTPFAVMLAYGAHRTARNLALANLAPDLLARTRIYSWCELDGFMYLLQNQCEGLYGGIRQAVRDGRKHPPAALACNHWRTAENEISVNYLADGAFYGRTPQEFYRRHLGALMGKAAAAPLAQALTELDEATAWVVEHLFNLGFCALGCWSLRGITWKFEDLEEYKARLGRIADQIAHALPLVKRTAGLARCRLLLNRLEASRLHCDMATRLRTMHDMVDWTSGKLPAEKCEAFRRHALAARDLARDYVAHCAALLPDRMSEGTVTNYEHVAYGLLDKTLKEFLGEDVAALETPGSDGPPAPMGEIGTVQ